MDFIDYFLKGILFFIILLATWIVMGFLMNEYDVKQWETISLAMMLIIPTVITTLLNLER